MTSASLLHGRLRELSLSRLDVAIVSYAAAATLLVVGLVTVHHRPLAAIGLLPAGLALILRGRPIAAGACIGFSATLLRLAYVGIGYSTQIDHARNAAARAFAGASPYGVLLPSATAPPEPYVYGPLGLLWWQPGVVVELLAAVGVTVLLISTRSWLTLAVYSGLPFSIYLTTTGVNDYSPGLLIAGGVLLLRSRPIAGATLLALAAALKPYGAAWFLPAIGFGGWSVAITLGAMSAVLWSPLLVWGPTTYLRSVVLNQAVHPVPENTLNLPILRWIAVPLAAAGLLVRRWDHAVLVGAAVFVTFLFLDTWASLGYWLAVIPAAGMALEDRWARA